VERVLATLAIDEPPLALNALREPKLCLRNDEMQVAPLVAVAVRMPMDRRGSRGD
jgi:hypothetical protein